MAQTCKRLKRLVEEAPIDFVTDAEDDTNVNITNSVLVDAVERDRNDIVFALLQNPQTWPLIKLCCCFFQNSDFIYVYVGFSIAFQRAAKRGQKDIVLMFLKNPHTFSLLNKEIAESAFLCATEEGQIDIIRIFFEEPCLRFSIDKNAFGKAIYLANEAKNDSLLAIFSKFPEKTKGFASYLLGEYFKREKARKAGRDNF